MSLQMEHSLIYPPYKRMWRVCKILFAYTHEYIYAYIFIYICVYVCVCS